MLRSALIALAVAAVASPALAQSHADHGAAHADHGPANHGHAHADFQSRRIHVRIDGPEGAPDLILIPGLTSSPRIWQGLVDSLSGRYRIHRIHVQGFAGAEALDNAEGPVAAPVAEEIARYIAEQGLEKPAVIGHSMGGTIAMMLSARHPDVVGRVMVVDMIPFMGNVFGGAEATPESVAPIAGMVAAGMANSTPEQWAASSAQSIAGMVRTESQRAVPTEDSARSDPQVASHAMRELIVTDLRPELANIAAPLTVLYVAFEGPGMSPEVTDAIYQGSFATRPGTVLKRIDDSAHFIMLDQPDAFLAEVNDFLD